MNILKKYNLFQVFVIVTQIVISKAIINKKVRLVKVPFSIINNRNISFGQAFTSGKNLRLECISDTKKKILFFGNNVKMNDYVHIACAHYIKIGDNTLIGSNILITDHLHGSYQGDCQDDPYSIPDQRKLSCSKVIIGNNCWIGDMVSVMPGVTIGNGSIIGANSVVTKSIPDNSIAVGNPCKIIKQYNDASKRWEVIKEKNHI